MTQTKEESKVLYTRLRGEALVNALRLADQDYDGNVSIMLKIAVKRLIEERAPELIATDTDLRAA